MEPWARVLILAGLSLLALGLLLQTAPWLGRLPGDLRIERPGFRLYLPFTTCLLVSAALSALWWVTGRWR